MAKRKTTAQYVAEYSQKLAYLRDRRRRGELNRDDLDLMQEMLRRLKDKPEIRARLIGKLAAAVRRDAEWLSENAGPDDIPN
jgi:hypothetical protein